MLPFLVLPAVTFPWPCSDGTKQVVSDVLAGGRPLGVGTTGTGVQCAELWSSNPDFLWQAAGDHESRKLGMTGWFSAGNIFQRKTIRGLVPCARLLISFDQMDSRFDAVQHSSVSWPFLHCGLHQSGWQTPRVWRTCPCQNAGHLNCPHASSRI